MITVLAFGPTVSGTVGIGKALDLITMSIGFSNSMGLTGRVPFWSSVEGACWLIVAFVISAKGVPRTCDASGITDGFGLGDGGVESTTFLLVANLRDDLVGRGVGGAEAIMVRSDDGESQIVIPARSEGILQFVYATVYNRPAQPYPLTDKEPQSYPYSVHFAEPMRSAPIRIYSHSRVEMRKAKAQQ